MERREAMTKKNNKESIDSDRVAKINDYSSQVYRMIKKKNVSIKELNMIMYRVKKMASSNSKV
jgi:hypothetical protein